MAEKIRVTDTGVVFINEWVNGFHGQCLHLQSSLPPSSVPLGYAATVPFRTEFSILWLYAQTVS